MSLYSNLLAGTGSLLLVAGGLNAQALVDSTAVLRDITGSDLHSFGGLIGVTSPNQGANLIWVTSLFAQDHYGLADPATGELHLDDLNINIADSNDATANDFIVHVFFDDPAAPGEPDLLNPAFSSAQFQTPGGGPGVLAGYDLIGIGAPATPLVVPPGSSVHIGVEVGIPGGGGTTSADFCWIFATWGHTDPSGGAIANFPFDAPNAGGGATIGHGLGNGGFTFVLDVAGVLGTAPGTAQAFFDENQYMFSILTDDQPVFTAGATTTQINWPVSNGPAIQEDLVNPGPADGFTSSFFSGGHPDMARLDDLYLYSADPNGDQTNPFFTFFYFGAPAAVPFDLNSLLPGSRGSICIDLAALNVLISAPANNLNGQTATLPLPLNHGGLIGTSFNWGTANFDFLNAQIHSGKCMQTEQF